MQLKDAKLFRQQCYIDGKWVERRRETIAVTNPVDDSVIGHVPKLGAAETRAPSRRRSARSRPGAQRPPRSAPPSCASCST